MQNEIQIRDNAAFWATTGSIDTSNKYKVANTVDIVNYFKNNGFYITHYNEAGVSKAKNVGKTKHIVRMRQNGDISSDAFEVLITNSHNKYSSLKINVGIYRMVCANGMVMGKSFFEEKIRHVGQDFDVNKKDLLEKVLAAFDDARKIVTTMKNTYMSMDRQEAFLDKVVGFRLRHSKEVVALNSNQVADNLKPQRPEDYGDDLYTVMNVIQERIIRGGFQYTTKKPDTNVPVVKTTTEIKGINNVIRFNQQLFTLAMDEVSNAA